MLRLVYRSAQLDDMVGIFGENMCNVSGNRLLSMICDGRKLVLSPSGQGLGLT